MPFTPDLAGGVFDQSAVYAMTTTFEACCWALKLPHRDNPLTEIFARRVVEIARKAERDPERICGLALLALSGDQRTA